MTLQPLPSWSKEATWGTFENGMFHGVIGGVEIQKSDDDLARYEALVGVSQPDVVIETGTRAGGSALWFMRKLGLEVITIDIAPAFQKMGSPQAAPPYQGPGIAWIRGSSIAQATLDQVLPLVRGKRVMVSLDSDHHNLHVQAEISMWGPLVTPGCYLVVEDACFDLFDEDKARVGGEKIPEWGGALPAIQAQLGRTSIFERDTEIEGMSSISHSPVGWWRRSDG